MNIASLLHDNAIKHPDSPCLITSDRNVSYKELDQLRCQLVIYFSDHHIRKGDVVLLFVPFSVELYAILTALFSIGAVAMLVDPGAGTKHINACCKLAQPDVFIGTPKAHLLRMLSPSLRRIKHSIVLNGWVPFATRLSPDHLTNTYLSSTFETKGHDPALITFTSGSTGLPKGVYRSHDFLINQHSAIENALKSHTDDIEINTLPVFVLSSIGSGLTSIIPDCDLRQPGAIDPQPVLKQIEYYKVNRILAPPAFCQRLVDHLKFTNQQLHGINKVFTGGGPVFPNLLASLQQVCPNAEVYAVYGSTEAEPMAHIAYHEISSEDLQLMQHGKGLLSGYPVPEVSLKILPDTFGKTIERMTDIEFQQCCLQEQIGEIVVTGQHVLKAYLNNVNPNGIKFVVGDETWHRTGDAGYFDSSGRLWLVGRCTARIKDSQGIIYPFSVECAAQSLKGITRTALIVHEDRRTLFIESEIKQDIIAMQAFLSWAKLERIIQIKTIPVDKRHNTKIDYIALHQLLA